jgi:lipopolysaccharide transport system ATP-binding protein
MSSETQMRTKDHAAEAHVASQRSSFAIRATNVSKCYHLFDKPQDRLKQAVFPHVRQLLGLSVRSYAREFWALQNISFDVRKGETVGIIGRNGSGKSTLLQIIAGTLDATQGQVEVNGRVAALLELGSGFNPDFTGRENVYMNAAIQGLSKSEIDAKFDDIAAFADIGEFLEQPTNTYSSGMLMRLAFAVNTCIEPEVLVVDEALGVGDAPFQSKCYKRLRRLVDDGKSVLFVSHDISTVRSICSRALWLKSGRAELWGDASWVSKQYEKYCWKEQGIAFLDQTTIDIHTGETGSLAERHSSIDTQGSDFASTDLRETRFSPLPSSDRYGTSDILITHFEMRNKQGEVVSSCGYGEELTLIYCMQAQSDIDSDAIIGILFRDKYGVNIYAAHNFQHNFRLSIKKGQAIVASTKLVIPLTHQDYFIQIGIFGFKDGDRYLNGRYDFSRAVIWDLIEKATILSVLANSPQPLSGPVHAGLSFNATQLEKP